MQTKLGCENRHNVFFHCEDCKHRNSPTGCALYRRVMDASVGVAKVPDDTLSGLCKRAAAMAAIA